MDKSRPPSGVLLVDKPRGCTSRDEVNRVGRALGRGVGVGHAGTLDPMATGLLVVCVGFATRLVEYVQRMTKTYEATVLLGADSDTDDADGQVVSREIATFPCTAEVQDALARQVGHVMQVPPRFSAVHVGGRRAYDLARTGQEFQIEPKYVHIHSINIHAYDPPRLQIAVACGSGTYIRSIARDLGAALGCGALLTALRRTEVGPFRAAEALALARQDQDRESIIDALKPASAALCELPHLVLKPEQARRVVQGQRLALSECEHSSLATPADVCLLGPLGEFLGVGHADPADGVLRPLKILSRL